MNSNSEATPAKSKPKVSAVTALLEFLVALTAGCCILGAGVGLYLTWIVYQGPVGSPQPAHVALPTLVNGGVPGYTQVRLYKRNGNLMKQLASEAQKAQAYGQAPFVEFDADW